MQRDGSTAHSPRGYACVGLVRPKNVINVGSVLRAAGNYEVALVVASGIRYRRTPTDTMLAHRRIPFVDDVADIFAALPYNCVPVAVDLVEGAEPLVDYKHPERAFYIFGPEDGTLGRSVTDRCRDVVYVPTHGCMNLAATVNVILYDRLAKQWRARYAAA